MDVTPLTSKTAQVIQSYGSGGFTIAGERYAHSVLIYPEASVQWYVTKAQDITPESLSSIIERAREIEILLIGTGAEFTPIDPSISKTLRPHGITVDAMDTGAACRTFNVLLLEGRRTAAALIAV
jgi:uncharacterized protein